MCGALAHTCARARPHGCEGICAAHRRAPQRVSNPYNGGRARARVRARARLIIKYPPATHSIRL